MSHSNIFLDSGNSTTPFIIPEDSSDDVESEYATVDQSHLQPQFYSLNKQIIQIPNEEALAEFLEPGYQQFIGTNVVDNEGPITPQKILKYLTNREAHDCTLMLFYPKAGTKSYSNEKRYYAPNPRIDLIGQGWNELFQKLKVSNSMADDVDMIKEFTAICKIEYHDENKRVESKKCNAKPPTLISQAFKIYWNKKTVDEFSLNFYISFGTHYFGSLQSQSISVISKSSKSVNSCDESSPQYQRIIKSGDTVAFFNRQSMNLTVFLSTENGCLNVDQSQWSAFEIYKVNENNIFDAHGQIIHKSYEQITFGSSVILIDTITKTQSPLMKIKKVKGKSSKNDDANEGIPVSELHNCIFEVAGHGFMTLNNSKNQINFEIVKDIEIIETPKEFQWFIVSAEIIKHQFYPIQGIKLGFCIPKFPFIRECWPAKFDDEGCCFCKFYGEKFSKNMNVWIGSFQCKVKSANHIGIEFYLPILKIYKDHCQINGIASAVNESVPIMLVSDDGVIFQTFYSYQIYPQHQEYDCGYVFKSYL